MKKVLAPSIFVSLSLLAFTAMAQGHGYDCSEVHGEGKGHGHHGHEMWKRMDTNGDQKLTMAEALTAAQARFKDMDGDKNLILSQEELAAFAEKKRAEHTLDPERARAHFQERDKNRNGKLELTETRMNQERFSAIDTNRDGGLTLEELKQARAAHEQKRAASGKHPGSHLLQRLDQNEDGAITSAENDVAAGLFFSEMDANKDGFVTPDEAKQGLKKNHKHAPSHSKKGDSDAKQGR